MYLIVRFCDIYSTFMGTNDNANNIIVTTTNSD